MSVASLPPDNQQHPILEGFRLLFTNNPLPMWIFDCETLQFLEVNEAAIAHYGYSLAEFRQMQITDIRPAEDVPVLVEKLARARSGQRNVGLWRHCRKNGQIITVEIVAHALEFEGRRAELVVIKDVTDRTYAVAERDRMEQALRESEAKFRTILEAIPSPILISRLSDSLILYANPQIGEVFGLPSEAIVGSQSLDFYDNPSDRQMAMDALTETGFLYDYEVKVKKADGTPFWAVVFLQRLTFAREQATLVVFHDITQRKQAEEVLRQQHRRARLVEEITRRIRQSLDLQEILDTTVTEVQQFLHSDRVLIYRLQPEEAVVVESVAAGWRSLQGSSRLSLTEAELRSLQQGLAMATDDVSMAGLDCSHRDVLMQAQIKARLIVPIVQGNLWGLLIVHQCSAVRHWRSWEIDLLQQLANQVAIAIHQSDLYQQVQQLNADLELLVERRTAQLQTALVFEATLKRITDKVRDSLDEDQILQTAVEELGQTLGVLGCDTGIYSAEQATITVRNEYFPSMPSVKGKVLQLTEVPEIHTSLQKGQWLQFCYIVFHPLRQIKKQMAILACPIMDTQTLIGDLWLFKPRDQWFDESETRLVQQVANQCAIAIRQARLYEASQVQIQELEKLHRLKDEFLSTISHELRTPISNMKMAIHMLKLAHTPDVQPGFAPRHSRYLDILQTECDKEAALISDLLDLQRLENQRYELQSEPINLQDWIPTLVEPFLVRAHQQQQILQVEIPDGLRAIDSDRSSLDRILAELLNNACKYTPTGGKIRLAIEQLEMADEAMTRFTVLNQAEIPQAELIRIFEKFYRVPHADPWKQSGTGLGLALVQQLVRQLGGTIQVQSGNETTFTVLLPDVLLKPR